MKFIDSQLVAHMRDLFLQLAGQQLELVQTQL